MPSLVILMIETEQPESLSARKLVVETAKHNVLTAYNGEDGIELFRRFPKVDAVLIHGLIPQYEAVLSTVQSIDPEMPIIVASPVEDHDYPGATYVVPSHEPAVLLRLLAEKFVLAVEN